MNKVIKGISITLCTALIAISLGASAKSDKKVEDELKIKKHSLTMPLSSSDSGLTPMGEAEHPGLCKYRGHEGKFQCINVTPKKHGKIRKSMCPGKNNYLTKGNCYKCPKGYKRNILHLKMTNAKACVKHQKGKNPKSAGELIGKAYMGCPKGQFKYDGYCRTCPAKTKRKHFMGLDKGQCRVEKKYRCNRGLDLHKSQPENIWNSLGNWAGLKHRKYCGRPFNLMTYMNDSVDTPANRKVLGAIASLGVKMIKKDKATKTKIKNFEKAVKKGDLKKAYNILKTFDEWDMLKDAVSEAGHMSISVAAAFDASFGVGYGAETGLAIDLTNGKLKKYTAHGVGKGFSFGLSAGVNIGVWKGEFKTSYAQGYIVDLPTVAEVGVWSDYYTPKRSSKQPRFVGMNIGFGVGDSVKIGEYNETWTKVGKTVTL